MTPIHNSPRDFRILSLDGGGIRGAFIASFVKRLAEDLGAPLHEQFDLIAGTSTGGIIAAALALGIEPSIIEDFYRTAGPRIFVRRQVDIPLKASALQFALNWIVGERAKDFDVPAFLGTKYVSTELHRTLTEVFGVSKIKDAKCLLTIPSIDLTKGQTVVIKTGHLPGMTRDPERKIVDVLLATAAAPTYFPHATIEPGSAFVDGGLWANNPSLVAYAEARKIQASQTSRTDNMAVQDVKVLSIGTGSKTYSIRPPGLDAGGAYWIERIIDVMGDSQSQGVHFAMSYLLPKEKYVRVDFELPDANWRLDNVASIDALTHLGREKANEQLASIRRIFPKREKPGEEVRHE